MSEFFVLGGERYLLDELSRRHKYYACDTDKDISNLLRDIEIVYKNRLKEFFENFLNSIKSQHIDIINDTNCEFWKEILFSEEDSIKEALAENVSKDEGMFFDFFNYYTNILELIVNSNSRFMQDCVNELLCKKLCHYYKYNQYFWKLLVHSLKIQPNILDVNSITNEYDNFKLIENININKNDEILLNQYQILKKFILNAGRDFFINDASSQWEYYKYGNKKDDKYVKICFNHLEWDMEIIHKMESEYEELVEGIDSRPNSYSKNNGRKRLKAYDEVIVNNGEKIRNII